MTREKGAGAGASGGTGACACAGASACAVHLKQQHVEVVGVDQALRGGAQKPLHRPQRFAWLPALPPGP